MTVTVRDMATGDLALLGQWLLEPHVARWWSDDPAAQLAEFADAIQGRDPTHVLVVEDDGRPVGWAQWYRWADAPDEAPQYGATEHDFGIDYGIGAMADVGRGVGTELIALLVRQIRLAHPQAPVLVAVATSNAASRRVLEKNGFALVDERMIEAEPGDEPTALYRLAENVLDPNERSHAELIAMEEGWAQAMLANDADRIAVFLAEDWVLVSESGHTPAAQFLALIRSGALTHSDMTPVGSSRVQVYGDTAVVTMRVTSTAGYKGVRIDADEWASDVFVRRAGQWRCVLTQLTAAVAPAS